jgi:hypothetical protein
VATLEYALEPAEPETAAGRRADGLRALARELSQAPVGVAPRAADE